MVVGKAWLTAARRRATGAPATATITPDAPNPTHTHERHHPMHVRLTEATSLIVDHQPDDRGQLMVAAVTDGGQMVALTLNLN